MRRDCEHGGSPSGLPGNAKTTQHFQDAVRALCCKTGRLKTEQTAIEFPEVYSSYSRTEDDLSCVGDKVSRPYSLPMSRKQRKIGVEWEHVENKNAEERILSAFRMLLEDLLDQKKTREAEDE